MAIAIMLCLTLLMGTTYAWFTDSTASSSNLIKTGTFDVEAYWADGTTDPDTATWKSLADGAVFDYDRWEPGYTAVRHVRVANEGSLALKYMLKIVPKGNYSALASVIDVYFVSDATAITSRDMLTDDYLVGTLGDLIEDGDGAAYGILLPEGATATPNTLEVVGSQTSTIVLMMRTDVTGTEYQNVSIGTSFDIKVVATQYGYEDDDLGNDYDDWAEYPVEPAVDSWDGTADTTWYEDSASTFVIGTAEQLAGFASLVDQGNNFEGKTVLLDSDIDLLLVADNGEKVSFDPIGDVSPFAGTFDGQGHSIENLYQSGWAFGYEWGAYGSIGLFGELQGATVKNLTISGAETFVEGGDVGGITGSATGDCTFENITIKDSDIATYNNGLGGIIGWAGEGNYSFKNVTIAEDVVLGGLWGSFDSSVGGIFGQLDENATANLEDVDVACRLDVYNDVTASYKYYNYRMCGMLIGRIVKTQNDNGTNRPDPASNGVTCTNVTVTYGDWSQYHYCENPSLSYGWKRVEAGYQYDGFDHSTFEHADGEAHELLLAFDQLFGGDQYGVAGLASYDGVDVIYDFNAVTE